MGPCRKERVDEIFGDFRLPVDRHSLAREPHEIDANAASGKSQAKAIMNQALLEHSLAELCTQEQFNSALLEDTGPNASGDVLKALPFENDVIDAVQI